MSQQDGRVARAAGPAHLVIDIETTGFSADHAHVIEVGAALLADGRVQRPVGMLVRPPRARDLTTFAARCAARVHRIPDEEVLRDGLEPALAAQRLSAYLDRIRDRYGEVVLWAHGATFERRFLGRHPWHLDTWRCSLQLAREALPERRSHKLGELCAHLDLPQGRAHRAPDDAYATAWLLLRLGVT